MEKELKDGFARIKPVCDCLMVQPTAENIQKFLAQVLQLKKNVVQELQQYLLFPFITHITATLPSNSPFKGDLQKNLVDAMKLVVGMVTVNSFELFMKLEFALLQIVFDKTKKGMLADTSEELKMSVVECMTVLLLNTEIKYREMMVTTQVPLLAQAVFVTVHIAKLEKSRSLKLAALNCLLAHTGTHPLMTNKYHMTNQSFEKVMVDMLASILPGVLSALQDVALGPDHPGHVVIVAALDATHRILCLTMANKHKTHTPTFSSKEFVALLTKKRNRNPEVSNEKLKDIMKRSPSWYAMASVKLRMVTRSLGTLRSHEHFKVRKELAILCARVLNECNMTMQPSMTAIMEVLIALTRDEYPDVAKYCTNVVYTYFADSDYDETKDKVMDSLGDNFIATLEGLPSVMNSINSALKASALNLVLGHTDLLGRSPRGRRVWQALGDRAVGQLCGALVETARLDHNLTLLTMRPAGVTAPPPLKSPWCKFHHLDEALGRGVRQLCGAVGAAPCAGLVADRLLDALQQARITESAYIMNEMAADPNSPTIVVKRILDTYLDEDLWYLPIEVNNDDPPLTAEDTLDVNVYNPRAWVKDSVPGLFEGATEVRYTDISYQQPRRPRLQEPGTCATLGEAQKNMTLVCLLTEGVGVMAQRLGDEFQPYMMKSICLILERVASPYEMLHLAGLKALQACALSARHQRVTELIAANADYCVNQVTFRLKKAWACESALQILSVVMEYSDPSIQDYLYGIVQDVLVQSCDKYYEKNLNAYLQVFLTFIDCMRKWFNIGTPSQTDEPKQEIDLFGEVVEYEKAVEEEKGLWEAESDDSDTSPEDLYSEHVKSKEESVLDYDDTVAEQKPPLPQHIAVTLQVLKRCVHLVPARARPPALALLARGLPLLAPHEDLLLPLVHAAWDPLVARFESSDPPVLKRALELLVTMASLSKDFIQSRAVKEVLPHIYKFLHKSSKDSRLKDTGSWYRTSPGYSLQVAALEALPNLVVDLGLGDERLEEAINCVLDYLSDKQPKPLQELAVKFFIKLIDYDYGMVWYMLRMFCNNEDKLKPPELRHLKLQEVIGTPYASANKEYDSNIKKIFDKMLSKE